MKTQTFDMSDALQVEVRLSNLIFWMKAASSKNEAKRLIIQNAVEINRVKINTDGNILLSNGDIIQVGKRHFRKVILPKVTGQYYEFEENERDKEEAFLREDNTLSEETIQRYLKEDFDA